MRMPNSQNATFHGPEPESKGQRVRGLSIAECLAAEFSSAGWRVDEVDCWRDAGYFVSIERNEDALEIVVIPFNGRTDCWILQIAPSRLPGLLMRYLGVSRSASPDSVFRVAAECHRTLKDRGFTGFRWCWDDLADNDECSSHPLPCAQ